MLVVCLMICNIFRAFYVYDRVDAALFEGTTAPWRYA